MQYTNSPLATYKKISPNRTSPRNHVIDTISIHCYVGQSSIESMAGWFANSGAQASSNYGIGFDGKIGIFVEEKDRSWCTSSRDNDNRAITIECACDAYHPYKVNDAVYKSLIELLTDICRRNNIKKLLWKADKSLIGQVDRQNMTVHRWFANKACPGDYLYNKHSEIAQTVNNKLNASVNNKNDTDNAKSNAEIIWDFFKKKGLNAFAIAGIMGNLRAESALDPQNMQDNFEPKLNYTDATYTKAVNNGSYKNFVNDGCGYGLAQWTYPTRKEELLSYAKSKNVSIGNLELQLDFLWKELQAYKNLMVVLKNATSVREASDAFLCEFEKPSNMGISVQDKRAKYGQEYYNQFINSENTIVYRIQVGAFTKKENAEKTLQSLKERGFNGILIYSNKIYRVQENAFISKENAEKELAKVKAAGFTDAFIAT